MRRARGPRERSETRDSSAPDFADASSALLAHPSYALRSGLRAAVAQFPVNNRRETGRAPRPLFSTPAGWFFARIKHARCRLASFRQNDNWVRFAKMNDWVRFAKIGRLCPGRSAARSGALQTRGRSSPCQSRLSDAPLRCVEFILGPREARTRGRCIASGTRKPRLRSQPLFTFQTAHLVPAPAFLRPGFALLLRSPRDEGWAERRETFGWCASAPVGRARNAARQAPSEAPCVP
jgi:hypothetical protein